MDQKRREELDKFSPLISRCVVLLSAENGVDSARLNRTFNRDQLFEKMIWWKKAAEDFEEAFKSVISEGIVVTREEVFAQATKMLVG